MDPSEMHETVMNPANRVLKQITMEDMDETSKVFNILMGDSPALRKVFIENNALKADIDI